MSMSDTTAPETIVIVGASLAGTNAAITLRKEGFGGAVILIGDEPQAPYDRPPLSKAFLRGERPFDKLLLRPPDYYATNGIETRFGARVVRVHAGERAVELASGERVRFGKLLIATGGRNRRLAVPGAELGGIHLLRTVTDADRIRGEIAPGRRAAVVGMGFIGAEVAASLRGAGLEVVVIEPLPLPFQHSLGPAVGHAIAELHRGRGVELVLGDAVTAFEGAGRVERVVTRAGRSFACDFAVVGVGIEPEVGLLAGTGVALDDGVLVDELCRTNVPDIYAAGDVARHHHPLLGRAVRVEHWQNAIRQGTAAALSMLGKGKPYDELHWFWSDQYDASLQYAGFHEPWDRLVVRGQLDEQKFIGFYLREGRVVAAVALNRNKDLRMAMPLVRARIVVPPDQLTDESVELRTLLG